MTALSIPERAREMLTCLHSRSDCWWNDEKVMTEVIAAIMRSEREVCAKELDKLGAFHLAKTLRDGGK